MDGTQSKLVRSVLQEAFKADIAIPMSAFADAKDEAIATGISAFDYGLLGIGGQPRGHFIEISGNEKTGKTTLLMHLVAGCQSEGFTPLIIDSKGATTTDVARNSRIGVDTDTAHVVPITTTEDAVQKMREAINRLRNKNLPIAIFWDDVGLVASEAESSPKKDRFTGKDIKKVGGAASSIWTFCRTLAGACYATKTPMCITNQLTAVIDTSWSAKFADKETTAGGRGLRYAARVRIQLHKGKAIKVKKSKVGHVVYAHTTANAFFPPERTVLLHLNYANGYIDSASTLLNAERLGVVTQKGHPGRYRVSGESTASAKLPEEWDTDNLYDVEVRLWPWIEEGLHGGFDGVDTVVDDMDDEESAEEDFADGW